MKQFFKYVLIFVAAVAVFIGFSYVRSCATTNQTMKRNYESLMNKMPVSEKEMAGESENSFGWRYFDEDQLYGNDLYLFYLAYDAGYQQGITDGQKVVYTSDYQDGYIDGWFDARYGNGSEETR